MSLLTICQDAADALQIDRPATVAGNTSTDAQKLLRYANQVGVALMREYDWQDLRTEKTFTGVAGSEQTSILPSDFDRFVGETFWDRTNGRLIAGPIHAVEWQGLKAKGYSGYPQKFIYRGDSVFVIPNMAGGESLAFEYISKNWCKSSGGTGQAKFAADTDVGVIDEELLTLGVIFSYLADEGQPFAKALKDFEDMRDTLIRNDQPDGDILVAADIFSRASRHFSGAPIAMETDF